MRQSAGDGPVPERTSSTLSGSAHEVVQARDISGGIHFHTAPRWPAQVSFPHQLPSDVRGFVGRQQEAGKLQALLADGDESTALIVVAGTAGVGKTSVAVHFAHSVRSHFPDGQLFVDLRGYDPGPPLAPGDALERFLRALGTAPAAIPLDVEERAALYRTLLAERHVLIVLDNAATVGQVRPLLPGVGGCLVVVTSRSRLSGLSTRDGARRITLGLLPEAESVALVKAVTSEYRTGDDPEQVAQLARLCARLPLALRIAAERAAARPLMPLRDLIEDLRGESSLWDALSSEDEADADAVRTVFAWSYRALPTAVARAFRLLGLHPGLDFGLGAAAALLGETVERARALLDVLTGAHMLEQTGAARYQYHDLLRAYAADLAVSQEEEDARRAALLRVAQWYLFTADAAMRATQTLRSSVLTDDRPAADIRPQILSDQASAHEWFLAERANLLALVRVSAVARLDEMTWQLSATLQTLQGAHNAADDRLTMGRLGLEATRRLGDRGAEARMLQALGFADKAAGRIERAAEHHRAALEIYERRRDTLGAVEALNSIGLIHLRRRELDDAVTCFERAVTLAVIHGHRAWYAVALDNLAQTRLDAGMLSEAVGLAETALRAHEEVGSAGGPRLETLITLIRAHRESGHPDQAEEYASTAERLLASGSRYLGLEVDVLLERAAIMRLLGDFDSAYEAYATCLQHLRQLNDSSREAAAYTGIGRILDQTSRVREAVDFHRRATSARRNEPDGYQLAAALDCLAESLDALGESSEARVCRAEAEELLSPFADLRASALHARLAARG
jgi:tetratricopeptide (TPR) repeat protein